MTVRGHFEVTSGTTVTLRLANGPAVTPGKAFVRISWNPSKIVGDPTVSYGGPIKGIGNLIWPDIIVPAVGLDIVCTFTLASGVTSAKIRSLVIDNETSAISTDKTTIS